MGSYKADVEAEELKRKEDRLKIAAQIIAARDTDRDGGKFGFGSTPGVLRDEARFCLKIADVLITENEKFK